MWLRLLLATLSISLVLSSLYVRPLPPGHGINGTEDRRLTDIEDMAACVDEWYENPPKVAVFYENTKNCVGYNTVWGRVDADPSAQSYILTPGTRSSDMCPLSAAEEFNKMVECVEGFKKAVHNNQVSCFRLVAVDKREKPYFKLLDEVVASCDLFDSPASIASAEEESAITELMYDEICAATNYGCEAIIGLIPTEGGYNKWLDGSELQYRRDFVPEMTATSCTSDDCSLVVIKWYQDKKEVKEWSQYEGRLKPMLLCKYVPEMINS